MAQNARPIHVTTEHLAYLAHRNPRTPIEFGDHDATLTLHGVTYMAEFDITAAVS